MPRPYRAAILHAPNTPLRIETVAPLALAPTDVVVEIKAAGLCHTDLEVIEGQLVNPMPIILGHEAAGLVSEVGSAVTTPRVGDHVILSWNPHCGHCFYCDRNLPILCEDYLRLGPLAKQFDGKSRAQLMDARDLHHLMYLGAFAEICIVPAQSAIPVPKTIPFDAACLIGCGVMTGAGAALNLATIGFGDTVVIIGCGAVGLSGVQGARLAGAGKIIAVDLNDAKLALAERVGATVAINGRTTDAVAAIKGLTGGRGGDVIIESAGNEAAFRLSVEACRPGGEVIWLGKTDVSADVKFRWGSLMQEKRIRRSSYGNARPQRDFPRLAEAYLDKRLYLDEMITQRLSLDQINDGFAALKAGETIRSVVTFD